MAYEGSWANWQNRTAVGYPSSILKQAHLPKYQIGFEGDRKDFIKFPHVLSNFNWLKHVSHVHSVESADLRTGYAWAEVWKVARFALFACTCRCLQTFRMFLIFLQSFSFFSVSREARFLQLLCCDSHVPEDPNIKEPDFPGMYRIQHVA